MSGRITRDRPDALLVYTGTRVHSIGSLHRLTRGLAPEGGGSLGERPRLAADLLAAGGGGWPWYRFQKFLWKLAPLGRKSRPFLLDFPLGIPQNLRDAPAGKRKFAISSAKKSKPLKNRALCETRKTPNPTDVEIEPPKT